MSDQKFLTHVTLGGVGFYYDLDTGKIYNNADGTNEANPMHFTDEEINEMRSKAKTENLARNYGTGNKPLSDHDKKN